MAAHHRKAAAGFSFKSLEVIIAYEVKDEETKQHAALLQQAIINSRAAQEWDDNTQAIVVSFHFGPKHDSMILFDSKLKQLLPAGMRLLPDNQSDIGSLIVWLQREASLSQPLTSEDIRVVLLAYGADFNWNEQMREAAQLLMNRHQIEFVFSMADQSTIERAIRKLERRGAKAAIIVRSFTMEESFRREIERMVGLDIENKAQNTSAHEAHVAQGFVQHGIVKNIPTRIRTPLPIRTTGGMGAHPLFAPPCLIVRAPYLEMRPKKTSLWWHMAQKMTSKTSNSFKHWKHLLCRCAKQAVMNFVQSESQPGAKTGQISVILGLKKFVPWLKKRKSKQEARLLFLHGLIMNEGHEKKFLAGLEYELVSGFASHPLFVQWVEEQIKAGMVQLGVNK